MTNAPTVSIAQHFNFQGCSSNNADRCACATWEPVECLKCEAEICDGERILTLTRPEYPYLDDDHDDQYWQVFVWHETCP